MSDSLTVGELKERLAAFDDNDELFFSGGLTFYRLKHRGENFVQVEFNEFEAVISDKTQKKYPNLKVAFCSVDLEGYIVKEITVPEL